MIHRSKGEDRALFLAIIVIASLHTLAQSVDWQEAIWREPQVRYLLADMTLGGRVELYRDYAVQERDPDSREAIRLWETGVRVANANEFERRWITNQFGKEGRVRRVVLRGSDRTISGNEVLLTNDRGLDNSAMRLALLSIALGKPVSEFEGDSRDASVVEAVRRWKAGARVLNAGWFEARRTDGKRQVYFKGTEYPADGARVRLNSDLSYPEVNVRYFMADMALGGSRDFYWRTAEIAHEMGCLEAVLRHDAGVKITNLDQFERKKVNGKTVITRKGSNERISGTLVKLSTDE